MLFHALVLANYDIYEDFEDMEIAMKSYGYDMEPYTVLTEDGWYLTFFRIISTDGQKLPSEKLKDKPPILIMNGMGQSGMAWFEFGGAMTIPGGIAERGYDVWVGNNRGHRYSNKNKRDGEWS